MNTLLRITFTVSIVLFFAGISAAQTFPAPTVLCVSTQENTGNVDITWTQPSLDPCGPFTSYLIYGATSINGLYSLVTTVSAYGDTTFTHVGANGTTVDWFYKIVMIQNCPGGVPDTSNIGEELVLTTPLINFVSVNPDNSIEIDWIQSPNAAPAGFAILVVDTVTGLLIRVDTVFGSSSTSYTDATNNPVANAITYDVKAFDDCGNETAINPQHRTINLTAEVNSCAQEVELEFNPYISWPGDSVANYELRVSAAGSQIDVVSLGNNFDPVTPGSRYPYNYDISGITNDTISFNLVAIHPNGTFTSSSNYVKLAFTALKSTAFNYLKNVTTNADGTVDVTWLPDTGADIDFFYIKRGTDSLTFQIIDSVATTPGSILPEYTYTDLSVDAEEQVFYYKIQSRDTCGFSLNSGWGRTIGILGFFDEGAGINNLRWDIYGQESGITVINHNVFRIVDGVQVPVETLLPEVISYQDVVANAITTNGEFCYVIVTEYQLSIPVLGISESLSSTSKEVCIDLPPVIYIPNAFVPNSDINKSFKPVLLFPVKEYEFRVFDRWGKEVFGTENIIAGWDGTRNGEDLPVDGYVYYVKVVSTSGIVVEKQGVVALIR